MTIKNRRGYTVSESALVCEVLHMLMIFFNQYERRKPSVHASAAMHATDGACKRNCRRLGGNGWCRLLGREKTYASQASRSRFLRAFFQFWLFVCIVIAYAATSRFTYVPANGNDGQEKPRYCYEYQHFRTLHA